MNIKEIIEKATETHSLTAPEIVKLLEIQDNSDEYYLLLSAADNVRKKYVGNDVHLRALIEFSNICSMNCFYCGLRRDNKNLKRYKLDPAIIIDFANNAACLGYKTIVLQSGEGNNYSNEEMIYVLKEIKKLNVAITLSIGEKTVSEYEQYKTAGADRFLLRIETTDRNLYKKLHPGMDFDNRVNCLKILKQLGYEMGTGSLTGLPEQTIESIANDILFFKTMDADMIGVGPFIPNTDTELANEKGGSFEMSMKVMAITRLLLPDINIPATTAMETLNPEGRIIALQSGANVVMPNVTETEYRSLYQLYPGKSSLDVTPEQYHQYIKEKIMSIDRGISKTMGFRKKKRIN